MTKDVYIFDTEASGEMAREDINIIIRHLSSLDNRLLVDCVYGNGDSLELYSGISIILNSVDGNINYVIWHNETLTNQYEWCSFNGCVNGGTVKLTYENYIDFQCAVIKYFGFTPYYRYNDRLARKLVEEINEGLAPYTEHRVIYNSLTARVGNCILFNLFNINFYCWHCGSLHNKFSWCPFGNITLDNVPLTNLNAPKLKNIVIRYYRERYEFDRGE